jgi:hypothetical protein
MNKMNSVVLKRDIKLIDGKLKKDHLYFFPDRQVYHLRHLFNELKLEETKTAVINELYKIVNSYSPGDKCKRVYIIRSGGIGDLIALSSLVKYISTELQLPVTFVTHDKYFDLFNWFDCDVEVIDFKHPIARYDMDFRMRNNIRQINFEGKIESSTENWFELFYERFPGIELSTWGRPHLSRGQDWYSERIDNDKPSILLCLKATAWIRSIALSDVYKALSSVIYQKDVNVYIHQDQLNNDDKKFLSLINDDRIKLIKAPKLKDYFDDLYFADQIISVDTGALHFREGIGKSALGIYGPFTAECRCKYYKYVKTIDIKAPCLWQPCFQHCNHHDEQCENSTKVNHAGPCLSRVLTKDIIPQLREFFYNNLTL